MADRHAVDRAPAGERAVAAADVDQPPPLVAREPDLEMVARHQVVIDLDVVGLAPADRHDAMRRVEVTDTAVRRDRDGLLRSHA